MNLGPLLYHYTDIKGESSIELSYQDLKGVILQIGFIMEVSSVARFCAVNRSRKRLSVALGVGVYSCFLHNGDT